ncbi:MAG: hypothetical protein AAF387_20160, partial [Pseudomonadota bacterium]
MQGSDTTLPLANAGEQILQTGTFSVWQDERFRWLQEGDAIQSVMLLSNPSALVLPTHQLMFLAFALVESPLEVLNLGFGLGAIERKIFQDFPRSRCTSVDISELLVNLAKEKFFVPSSHDVKICPAEEFLVSVNQQFDIVFIDLFVKGKTAEILAEEKFYRLLSQCVNDCAFVALNIIPDDENELLTVLLPLRKYFPSVAMATVENRSNIIILASKKSSFDLASGQMGKPGIARQLAR